MVEADRSGQARQPVLCWQLDVPWLGYSSASNHKFPHTASETGVVVTGGAYRSE